MSAGGALSRARLGVGLRRLPTELLRRCGNGAQLDPDVLRAAEDLERTAPGIGLMLQLRARLFDDALGGARRRRMTQVVATGCGLDDARLEAAAAAGMRVWHVEEPEVLAAKADARSSIRPLPAEDLSAALWRPSARDALQLATRRTFFLVQNGSFWRAADGLRSWLRAFGAAAAAGSEALLNVFVADDEAAAHVATVPSALPDRERSSLSGANGATINDDRLHELGPRVSSVLDSRALQRWHLGCGDMLVRERYLLQELGLRISSVFDSRALQRWYLGFGDMLVRERYLWVSAYRAAQTPRPATRPLPALLGGPATGRSRGMAWRRPALRSGLVLRWARGTRPVLVRRSTPLRCVTVALNPVGMLASLQLDGTRALSDVVAGLELSLGQQVRGEVQAALSTLRTVGFVSETAAAGAGARSPLCRLAERAIGALRDGDVRRRRQAAAAFRSLRANRAARHLETMLARCNDSWDVALVGSASPFVVSRRCDTARPAPAIAAEARRLLEVIAGMLGVPPSPRVVIDITSDSAVTPLVLTDVDEPYTLVRMPRSHCTRAALAHELTHVLAMARSRWLSEGLAVWVQRRVTPGVCFPDDPGENDTPASVVTLQERLGASARRASGGRGALARRRARCEYREAAAFVEFFVRSFTLDRFLALFAACTAAAAPDDLRAVCRSIGCTSLADLERRWRVAEGTPAANGKGAV